MIFRKHMGFVLLIGFTSHALALEAVEDTSATLVWITSSAGTVTHEGSDQGLRYEADSAISMVGVDHAFNDLFSISAGVGKGSSEVEPLGRENDESRSTDVQIGARLTPAEWAFGASIFHRDYRTERARVIALPVRETIQRVVLDARVDSKESGFEISAARNFDVTETVWVAPTAGISYVRIDTEDFIEQAGARSVLEVITEPEKAWFVSAGMSAGGMFFAGDWAVLPSAHLGVEYLMDSKASSSVATFVGTRYGYVSEGFDVDRTRLSVGGGVAFRHFSGFGARLELSHDRQSGYRHSGMSLGLEYDF